jgi:hypothetical protein
VYQRETKSKIRWALSTMLKYFRLVGLTLLLSVGLASVAKAASFDCNKATTETEIAICADSGLSVLDELMGELWQVLDASDSFVTEQKAWLRQRDEIQPGDSKETKLEHLYYKYLPRVELLMGILNHKDVINIFENSKYWEVDRTASETVFIFSHKDFQILFVPPLGDNKSPYIIGNYNSWDSCDRTVFSFQKEDLVIEESCNRGFLSGVYFDTTYSLKNGFLILSRVSEGSAVNVKYLHADYETGITSVDQDPCVQDDAVLGCFLEPTEFTYSFNNQKKFKLGSFSRDELPHKNQPVDFEKKTPEDYFKTVSSGNHEFTNDHSYTNLTAEVTSLFSNMSKQQGSHQCGDVLSGYSKATSGYTAVFSSFSELRNSFSNDDPFEFNLNNYLTYPSFSKPLVSLSHVLAFLDFYAATESIISFWFNKFDEDTKRQLSHFSKYAVEYRKKTGALLSNCFDDFEKIDLWVESFYEQNSGKQTKFLWKPINEYLDGFWERRSTDGTADQVQSILEQIAD